jgi:hypothetical protein
MIRSAMSVVILTGFIGNLARDSSPPSGLLSRRYRDGERLTYLMKGRNNDRTFEVRLTAVVKRGTDGQFLEEYAWSDLVWAGAAQPLTPSSRDFRQAVTLTGGAPFAFPDLSRVQPGLIGPVTDLLTFYADLFLAMHAGQLRDAGDRFSFATKMASSWADGTRVLIGEDDIDFDVHLTRVDRTRNQATLLVKHLPPKTPAVRIPAEWMRAPVADVPNNWIQVRREGAKYVASVGKETFDVELMITLSGGEILSATLDNVVEATARECANVELTDCGDPRPERTVRRIEMTLTGRLTHASMKPARELSNGSSQPRQCRTFQSPAGNRHL